MAFIESTFENCSECVCIIESRLKGIIEDTFENVCRRDPELRYQQKGNTCSKVSALVYLNYQKGNTFSKVSALEYFHQKDTKTVPQYISAVNALSGGLLSRTC